MAYDPLVFNLLWSSVISNYGPQRRVSFLKSNTKPLVAVFDMSTLGSTSLRQHNRQAPF